MSFPERCDEEIERLAIQQEAHETALEPRSAHQRVADFPELRRRLADRNLASHRMGAEPAPDLAFERTRLAGEGSERVVRAPVQDFHPARRPGGEEERHVERDDSATAPRELGPERLAVEPVGGHAAQPHGRGVPLQVVVDAVIAGRRRRVERGPDRSRQDVGGGAQRRERAAREDAGEVGQPARPRPDASEIGRVEPDHRDSLRRRHAGRIARPPEAADRAAASTQRAFTTASSKPGQNGVPLRSASTNEERARRIEKRDIVRSRRRARYPKTAPSTQRAAIPPLPFRETWIAMFGSAR